MPSKMRESTRRSVVKQGLGLGLSLTGSAMAGGAAAKAVAGYQPSTLTQSELVTLKAVMARLIPADDKMGGAVEACAYIYVDRALGAHHARHHEAYHAGLAELVYEIPAQSDIWSIECRRHFFGHHDVSTHRRTKGV